MSRQYPIWNRISSCAYKNGNKSYGVREHSEVEVCIGTSSMNSNHFLDHKLTHKKHENGDRTYWFSVDNVVIKKALLKKGANDIILEDI